MNFANMPIETQLAFILPWWLMPGLLLISIAASVGFWWAGRKYVREIKDNFPRLNFKINCILFVLMYLSMIAQIAALLELGTSGHAGIGWLYFFIAKYFIARSIVWDNSEHWYIYKTILIYTMVFIALSGCGLILGGLLWQCLSLS